MENIINNAMSNIELQVAKLNELKSLMAKLKTDIQWCYKYDVESSSYTDEVLDETTLKACTAIYKDICRLYKLGDC